MSDKYKAVFFDRDGTLNVDTHFLHMAEDFIWTPEARQAIKYCNDLGYKVVIITNQSGIARGYYPEEDVITVYNWMNTKLSDIGAHLDGLYYCPHHTKGNIPRYTKDCDCRKPKPKMILQASKELNIDLAKSYMIGDSARDVECAEKAGATGILYQQGTSLLKLVQNYIIDFVKD